MAELQDSGPCVMVFYEGAELARIVNKVLGNTVVVVYLYFEMCL